MADRIESYKVICAGGLNSNENHLELSDATPGAATALLNYEPSLFGGYRRINGYEKFDSTFPKVGDHLTASNTAEGRVLGVSLYRDDTTDQDVIIAFRKDIGSNTYSAYKYVAYLGWVKYTFDHGITRAYADAYNNPLNKIRFATFNFGDGNKIIFVDGINPALIFDGTEWNEITTSGTGHSTTGGGSSPGGPMAFDAPALVDVFKNHIFLGGDNSAEAELAHSAPNTPHDFTSATGAGRLTIGFDVVTFKPFRDDLFIFGGNGIKKATADTTSAFLVNPVTANVGCIARDSVQEIGGDLVFLAPDGIRPVAGTSRIGDIELETISKPIQQLLTELPLDYDLDNLNGVVIRTKSQLRYFIGDDTDADTDESFGIIGGLRSADQKLGWEFGELKGIRASCCASGYIGRFEYVLHGDYDGTLFRQEQGTNFDGLDILAVYTTPYYDFGDTQIRKTMRQVNTFIRAEGPLTMNLAVSYDWHDQTTATPTDYSASSEGAPVTYKGRNIIYGGANTKYGGSTKPIMTTELQGSGYSTQLTFVSSGDFHPYSIQGMVFEFSVAGRR